MKTNFRYISAILFFALTGYGIWWIIGVIWLRPADIDIYFQRIALEFATSTPEKATPFNMPRVELVTPYHSLLDNDYPMAPLGQPMNYLEISENLKGYNYSRLSDINQYYFDILDHWVQSSNEIEPELSRLFPLNHIDGIWPRFLYLMDVLHPIHAESGGVSYIDRLKRWSTKMERTLDDLKEYPPQHYIPAPYLIDSAIHQLDYYLQLPTDQHPLYRAFARKAISSDPVKFNEERAVTLLREVARVLEQQINPALESARTFLTELKVEEVNETKWMGTYKESNDYYQHFLNFYSTMPINIDSLFEVGMNELKRREEQYSFKTWDMQDNKEPKLEENKKLQVDLLKEMDSLYENIQVLASGLFEITVSTPLYFKYYDAPLPYSRDQQYQFSPYLEKGTGWVLLDRAFYNQRIPSALPTMVYYHTYPGLHALHAYKDEEHIPPLFTDFLQYPAFERGWGLYVLHSLDQQLQLFSNEPSQKKRVNYEHYLHLLRMLTDIGVHHKKWSLSEAHSFLEVYSPMSNESRQKEINRILLQPGLHSSGWIGYSQIQILHTKIQNQLGDTFALQDFHELILRIGDCPLPVLSKHWIKFMEEES